MSNKGRKQPAKTEEETKVNRIDRKKDAGTTWLTGDVIQAGTVSVSV